MATVQLPESKYFDTKMAIHTSTHNYDVILAQEFQKHLSNASHKYSILYYWKHKICQENWTNREYNVKNNEDVEH